MSSPRSASDRLRVAPHRGPVDHPEPTRFAAEGDVLRDREVRQQVDLLVDRADAGLLRLVRRAEPDRPSRRAAARPRTAASAPVIALIRVDLPAPFSPMSECTSPGNSRKSTPSSDRVGAEPHRRPGELQQRASVHRPILAGPDSRAYRRRLRADHDDALHDDEHQQQEPDDDPRPRLLGAHERDDRLDGAVDEHADHRPEHVAGAAGQQRAADHDRGDHVELGADAVARIAGAGVRREHQPGETAADAADDVDEHLGAGDVQAHQPSGLLAAADRVDRCARSGCTA